MRALAGGDVERDLGGVHLEREVDVDRVEHVEDGSEAPAEVGVAGVPERLRGGRERVDRVPDRRAGEAALSTSKWSPQHASSTPS
jgi:hypothetical protein